MDPFPSVWPTISQLLFRIRTCIYDKASRDSKEALDPVAHAQEAGLTPCALMPGHLVWQSIAKTQRSRPGELEEAGTSSTFAPAWVSQAQASIEMDLAPGASQVTEPRHP